MPEGVGGTGQRNRLISKTSRSCPSSRDRKAAVVISGDRRGVGEHELIRAAGTAGSIGTYAAPVFTTATIATTASVERGNNNATRCPGAGAVTAKQMRQPVRRLIQLAVRHRGALEGHGLRIGGSCHLCGEHLRDRHRPRRRSGQHGPVTPPTSRARSAASRTSTDDSGRVWSAAIAASTCSNRPARSETSKFENGSPAPDVLR